MTPASTPAPSGPAGAITLASAAVPPERVGESAPPPIPSYELLGVRVHAMTLSRMLAAIDYAATSPHVCAIANHNLHSVYLYQRDTRLRAYCDRAAYTFIDGMSLVAVGRLLGLPLTREHRHTSIDWLPPVLAHAAERSWRIFCLGSAPGVVERAITVIRHQHPGLQLRGRHGYFDPSPDGAENRRVVGEINAFAPHLLLVGMGMPRQEHWIIQEIDRLRVGAVLNLGAFLDYVAGVVPTPPRWLARLGFEWLGRLTHDPGRLWRRYLYEPLTLLPLLARELRGATLSDRTRSLR